MAGIAAACAGRARAQSAWQTRRRLHRPPPAKCPRGHGAHTPSAAAIRTRRRTDRRAGARRPRRRWCCRGTQQNELVKGVLRTDARGPAPHLIGRRAKALPSLNARPGDVMLGQARAWSCGKHAATAGMPAGVAKPAVDAHAGVVRGVAHALIVAQPTRARRLSH